MYLPLPQGPLTYHFHLLPSTLQGALEKHEPACFVVCRDAAQAALLEQHAQTVLVLARSSKAPPPASLTLVAAAAVPRGCVSEPVSSSTEVHVLLKGVIDFAKEVQRLQKEQKTVQTYLEKLEAKVSAKDYASRAPAATQEEDRGKIADTEVGLANIRQAIQQFEEGQDLD